MRCHLRPTLGRLRPLLVASASTLSVGLASGARAQGIGPPRGTEVLLVLFLVAAAILVLVVSAVLYHVGKGALFKGGKASRGKRLGLFAVSMLVSAALGVVIMLVLGLR